jgi:hypothetical protein
MWIVNKLLFLQKMKNVISTTEKLNDFLLLVRFIRDTVTGIFYHWVAYLSVDVVWSCDNRSWWVSVQFICVKYATIIMEANIVQIVNNTFAATVSCLI